MSTDEYVLGEAAPSGSRPPGDRMVVLVAGLVVLILIVATIVGFRPDAPPLAAPAESSPSPSEPPPATLPPPDVLDETGLGQIRVGMSEADYVKLQGGAYEVEVMGNDTIHGCDQYADWGSDTSFITWVWARDGRIETVGVQYAESLPTSFGPDVGGALDPADESLSTWTWDETAPVPVARLINGDRVLTIADTQSNGILDYATVGTAAGEERQADIVPGDMPQEYDPSAPAIDGTSLLGLRLGMTITEVRAVPGWTELDDEDPACSFFLHDSFASVTVRDVVVGLGAQRVAGGPSAGETVNQILAVPGTQYLGRDPARWTTDIVMPDGRRLRLTTQPEYVVPVGLDTSVAVPKDDPGEEVVWWISLGDSCQTS